MTARPQCARREDEWRFIANSVWRSPRRSPPPDTRPPRRRSPARALFESRRGRFIAIGEFQEFGPGDFLFDYDGGRAGKLVPDAMGGLALAPTFDGSGEPVARLGATARGVTYAGESYSRVRLRRREFTIAANGVLLKGEIAAPYWRQNRAPLLAIFGGKDVIAPAAANGALLESMIADDVDFTNALLPEANHLGFIGETGVRAEYPSRTRIDPGYFPLIEQWLADRF